MKKKDKFYTRTQTILRRTPKKPENCLRGHLCLLQNLVSLAEPSQGFPPLRANSFMVLCLLWNPPPQVLLQDDQSEQSPHWQSIELPMKYKTRQIKDQFHRVSDFVLLLLLEESWSSFESSETERRTGSEKTRLIFVCSQLFSLKCLSVVCKQLAEI